MAGGGHEDTGTSRTAFELPQQILRELLDDFVLVPEDALRAATRLMIEKTRNLVEPAGAAARRRDRPRRGSRLEGRPSTLRLATTQGGQHAAGTVVQAGG